MSKTLVKLIDKDGADYTFEFVRYQIVKGVPCNHVHPEPGVVYQSDVSLNYSIGISVFGLYNYVYCQGVWIEAFPGSLKLVPETPEPVRVGQGLIKSNNAVTVDREALFEAIKHGDQNLQSWLRKTIDRFFDGEPNPGDHLPRPYDTTRVGPWQPSYQHFTEHGTYHSSVARSDANNASMSYSTPGADAYYPAPRVGDPPPGPVMSLGGEVLWPRDVGVTNTNAMVADADKHSLEAVPVPENFITQVGKAAALSLKKPGSK